MSKPIQRLLVSIEHLSDRGQKYDILLKNRLFAEASELLFEAADMEGATLYTEERAQGMLFYSEHKEPSPFDNIVVYFDQPGLRKRMYLRGLIIAMKWSADKTLAFLRILFATMRKSQRDLAGNPAHPLLKLARALLAGEELQSIERDVLLARLHAHDPDNLWGLKYWILPKPAEYRMRIGEPSRREQESELDPIVDRARELGMTDDEIVAEFLGHLRWLCQSFPTALHIPTVRGLAFAKCFTAPNHIEERVKLLREEYLPTIQTPPFLGHGLVKRIEQFFDLWSVSGKIFTTHDGAFFRPELIEALSRGEARMVREIIRKYGFQLELYPDDIRRMKFPHTPLDDREERRTEVLLGRFAHEAYPIALEAKRFGVAAGLGQFERSITSKRKLLAVVRIALDLEQSIQLH